jgi:hypothetical protein
MHLPQAVLPRTRRALTLPALALPALAVPTLVASLVSVAPAPAQAQTTLSFTPAAAVVSLGDTIALDIVLNDRTAASPVAFFDLDVVFDPAVLSFSGLSLSNALGDIGLGQAVNASLPPDPGGGVLNLAVLSLLSDLSAQPLSPLLGRVSFSAIGLGDAGIGFGFTAIEDMAGNLISATALEAAVSVVPEPRSLWLLAAGVLTLAARRARQRA